MNEYNPVKSKKRSKNVAILFSGGLDSTYLLWKNLEDGNHVTPYYTEILNNTTKSKIEKQQISRIIGTLRQKYSNLLDYPRYTAKAELYLNYWSNSLKFKQTPLWLMSTLYMDNYYDEIQIGYVANDDSIPYIKEIKATYKALGWLLDEGKKRPELTFPIYQKAKFQMLDELPFELKSLIYSCEAPYILDEHEVMNEDSLTFYRGSLIEFFDKNKEGQYVFLKHEPCGECDPCRKILHNHYNQYVSAQPIYEKLRMKEIMRDYDKMMREMKYDEKMRNTFGEINRVHNYRTTIEHDEEKWKEVQLLPDHMQNEVIGNDIEGMTMEKMDKIGS